MALVKGKESVDSGVEDCNYDELGGLHPATFTFGGQEVTVNCLDELDFVSAMALLSGDDNTGQMVWKGARLLCAYLSHHVDVYEGKTVIDLGCGTGLASFFVAPLSKCVFATDGTELSIRALQRSIPLQSPANQEKLHVVELSWSSTIVQALQAKVPTAPSSFEVIIAADVIYSRAGLGLLIEAVEALLPVGGSFVLSHFPRMLGKDQREVDASLVSWLESLGTVTRVPMNAELLACCTPTKGEEEEFMEGVIFHLVRGETKPNA